MRIILTFILTVFSFMSLAVADATASVQIASFECAEAKFGIWNDGVSVESTGPTQIPIRSLMDCADNGKFKNELEQIALEKGGTPATAICVNDGGHQYGIFQMYTGKIALKFIEGASGSPMLHSLNIDESGNGTLIIESIAFKPAIKMTNLTQCHFTDYRSR